MDQYLEYFRCLDFGGILEDVVRSQATLAEEIGGVEFCLKLNLSSYLTPLDASGNQSYLKTL